VDEGRKRTLVIAAAIIAARNLAQINFKHCPAYESAISNAVLAAEKIMRKVDSNWPGREQDRDF
jgi:hypothetical protein